MNAKKDLDVNVKDLRALVDRYRVVKPDTFDLDRFSSDDLPEGYDKDQGRELLTRGVERLAKLQELLYANASWSLLVIFQAMDAAGKDSTIEHVMSGVNPQGVHVTSFKAPGPEDLAHDFLWRVNKALPARGMIGIFNRSHYEEVLAVRVHPNLLEAQHLPKEIRDTTEIWTRRIADIAAFEAYLGHQGIRVLKFFLNVGLDEQRERLLARLDDPAKNWKFDPGDLKDRELWPAYRNAYQAAIAGTATTAAPWFVVPADRKWFMRLVVAEAIIATLEDLKLTTPEVDEDKRPEFDDARHQLEKS